jgi:hypothetical protein
MTVICDDEGGGVLSNAPDIRDERLDELGLDRLRKN